MRRHRLFGLALAFAFASHYSPLALAQTLPDGKTSWTADNGNGTFTNPLFYDEFSDPDILRVGDDYYLAGTTMHSVPGVVILHSKDLVNWENISYCMPRFDFGDDRFALKNNQEIYGRGVWSALHTLQQRQVLRVYQRQRQGPAVLHGRQARGAVDPLQHEGQDI